MAMANPSSFDILESEPSLSWGIIVESLLSASIAELSESIVASAGVDLCRARRGRLFNSRVLLVALACQCGHKDKNQSQAQ